MLRVSVYFARIPRRMHARGYWFSYVVVAQSRKRCFQPFIVRLMIEAALYRGLYNVSPCCIVGRDRDKAFV